MTQRSRRLCISIASMNIGIIDIAIGVTERSGRGHMKRKEKKMGEITHRHPADLKKILHGKFEKKSWKI